VLTETSVQVVTVTLDCLGDFHINQSAMTLYQ